MLEFKISADSLTISWVRHEVERYRVVHALKVIAIRVIDGKEIPGITTLCAEPEANGTGWKHFERCFIANGEVSGEHKDGYDRRCFSCWSDFYETGKTLLGESCQQSQQQELSPGGSLKLPF